MGATPIDLDDIDSDDDSPLELVPITNTSAHARAATKTETPGARSSRSAAVKPETPGARSRSAPNKANPPSVRSSKSVKGTPSSQAKRERAKAAKQKREAEAIELPDTDEEDSGERKLLTKEQRAKLIEVLSAASNANDVIIKLRDATITKLPCYDMEPLSMEQVTEGLREWELETLPSVHDIKSPWVFPGRKARVPGRRIQKSFFSENRTMLVGESTALALRCHAHPDDVVETVATGHVRLPALSEDFMLHIKSEVVSKGLLSSPQLESVSYAARRFTQRLPDGSVGGYCLGDGTGCGKGRVIAALIIHLWNQGFKRHLWVSVSKDLVQDAKRDLKDLGAGHIPVFDITEGAKNGVAFSTYALIGRRHGDKVRMKDFFDFFGQDGGGLLCFDEAHKAKNLQLNTNVNAKRDGKGKGSKVALAIEEMQRMLPNAKVLYSSATAATEIKHMGYMTRLGLWGPKKSFANFKIFESNIAGGGVAAMEMLAINMKAMGMLSCRSLAYTGVVFEVIHTQLLPKQKKMYDGAVAVFHKLKATLRECLSDENISKHYLLKKKALFWMSYFFSVQQRFFKQLLVAFKVDEAVKRALHALDNDYQVVLSMWGTGAARIDAKLKETEKQRREDGLNPLDHEDLLSGPEMTLEHAIEQLILPIDDGMLAQQKALIAEVKELNLPANSLDDLIDKLGGPNKVAEMSGRSSRLLRSGNGGNGAYQYISRGAGKDAGEGINLAEQRSFQKGTKKIAIITEAASTGISLHADNRLHNTCRRLMITLELPWGADKAIQQFGRVHRSNQHSAPRFQIIITPVSGEVRFASTIAQRIKWLGAMTKGDRNLGVGGDLGDQLVDYDVHNIYGKRALSQFFQDLRTAASDERKDLYEAAIAEHIDLDFDLFAIEARSLCEFVDLTDVTEKRSFQKVDELVESSTMNQFLNRILMFPLNMQNAVFDCFMAVYDELVSKDKEAGEFSEAQISLNQQLMTVSLHDREHVHHDKSGAVSDLVTLQLDRGVAWDIALKIYDASIACNSDEYEGFYHFFAHFSQIKEVVLIRQSPRRSTYEMITPHNGVKATASSHYVTKSMLCNASVFRRIRDLKTAKEGWDWQREVARDKCIHKQRGFKCAREGFCKEGKRLLMVTLLSGAFLEVWGFLSQHVQGLSRASSRCESKALPLVSVRVEERTVVGVRLAPESVPEVSYVLRNMQSDAEQSDEDTTLAIIALYKAKGDRPNISTWIEAHQALVPEVAQSQQGLSSVKGMWICMRALHIIQELVGGGTTCRIPQGEAFWNNRWGQKLEVPTPALPPPKPVPKAPIKPAPGGGSEDCMAISDDSDASDRSAKTVRLKNGKEEKSVEPQKKMKPWDTMQDMAQKRLQEAARHMKASCREATSGQTSGQCSVDTNEVDDDDASSMSRTSSGTSSSESLMVIADSPAPSKPDVEPQAAGISTADTHSGPSTGDAQSGAASTGDAQSGGAVNSPSDALLGRSVNSPADGAKRRVSSPASAHIGRRGGADGHASAERRNGKSPAGCEPLQNLSEALVSSIVPKRTPAPERSGMDKKLSSLRKWMINRGRADRGSDSGGNEPYVQKKRDEVVEQVPLKIKSLKERRKLAQEHADSNQVSPTPRPEGMEDKLLNMLYTPPQLQVTKRIQSEGEDDAFAPGLRDEFSDGDQTSLGSDTELTSRFRTKNENASSSLVPDGLPRGQKRPLSEGEGEEAKDWLSRVRKVKGGKKRSGKKSSLQPSVPSTTRAVLDFSMSFSDATRPVFQAHKPAHTSHSSGAPAQSNNEPVVHARGRVIREVHDMRDIRVKREMRENREKRELPVVHAHGREVNVYKRHSLNSRSHPSVILSKHRKEFGVRMTPTGSSSSSRDHPLDKTSPAFAKARKRAKLAPSAVNGRDTVTGGQASKLLERVKFANHDKLLRGFLRSHDVAKFALHVSRKTDFTYKESGRTLLHEAISSGNADAVEKLLNVEGALAMLEEPDNTGARPLHVALRLPQPLHMIEVLLGFSPNLSTRDGDNRTPLECAKQRVGDHRITEAMCALLKPPSEGDTKHRW